MNRRPTERRYLKYRRLVRLPFCTKLCRTGGAMAFLRGAAPTTRHYLGRAITSGWQVESTDVVSDMPMGPI